MARLKNKYDQEIFQILKSEFGMKSAMRVPKLVKITLNMGLGEAVNDKKVLLSAADDIQKITGQKPVTTLAKKSEAGFKIRDGWPVGIKVTLRRKKMYEFLDRIISIALPRVRDFRGLPSKSFDGRGNYAFGIKEQIVFPEIDYDVVDSLRGMDICITTSTSSDKEAEALLRSFNFPLKKN